MTDSTFVLIKKTPTIGTTHSTTPARSLSIASETEKNVLQTSEYPAHAPSGMDFGQDFSRVAVQPRSANTQSSLMPSRSLTPIRCPFGGACHTCPVRMQPKLVINRPGDELEQEADRIAEMVMHMPEPKDGGKERLRRANSMRFLQRWSQNTATLEDVPPIVLEVLRSPGQSLDPATRAFMEPRFGWDFSQVQLHVDSKSAESAQAVKARAYTVGRNVVFGAEQYAPETREGQKLLAHEFAHVLQQTLNGTGKDTLRRANLTSPRLAGNPLFENVLDNRAVIEIGDRGSEVTRIQQLLIDLGFDLSTHGADGDFGTETADAVKEFQKKKGLRDDGQVGFATIDALDKAFPAFSLPANSTAPWSMPCVLNILCPWNKHLVENVLPGFNIITFDSRTIPTETWNGTTWVASTVHSGGFTGGTNMGFLNTVTCEEFAFTIYHEGWHAQQPSSLTGVVEVEKDAYINAEQWSISVGIPGQTFENATTGNIEDLRTTQSGETVVDRPAAERLVRQGYGGVSSVPGERILSRVGASDVRVRRPDGSEYGRAAQVGERVKGTATMTNQHMIDPRDWVCP